MLVSIKFQNYKILRDATLPLGQFTLIVGPNGSGKSTALSALQNVSSGGGAFSQITSWGNDAAVEVTAVGPDDQYFKNVWEKRGNPTSTSGRLSGDPGANFKVEMEAFLRSMRPITVFSFSTREIASPVAIQPDITLRSTGAGLSGVIDRIRDRDSDRFDQLEDEVRRWFPEMKRLHFDVTQQGHKSLALQRVDGQKMPLAALSDGTLLALAMLTLAFLDEPPAIIGIEEPERGIHPRLLREVHEVLHRLSHPNEFGDNRPAVQVIATTHSPYLLDFYKDRPEEVVIAERIGNDAKFERLCNHPDFASIIEGTTSLGEIWYSGVLGGVPVGP